MVDILKRSLVSDSITQNCFLKYHVAIFLKIKSRNYQAKYQTKVFKIFKQGKLGAEKGKKSILKASEDLNLKIFLFKNHHRAYKSLHKAKDPIGSVIIDILSFRQKKLTSLHRRM